MSHAIHNAKMLLQAPGSGIESASKAEVGQLAVALNTSGKKRIGGYYNVSIGKTHWHNNLSALMFNTKYGVYQPRSATFANNFDGILTTPTSSSGTVALGALDTALGMNNTFTTGAVAGNTGGWNKAQLYTVRDFNPIIMMYVKNSVSTNLRYFLGWTGSTALVGNNDDQLNAANGFGIAKLTTSSNLRCIHNDGSGVTVSDDTGVAASTSAFFVMLWADGNNNKFWWSINGSTPIGVTTDIPGATVSLSCQDTLITTAAAGIVHTSYGGIITTDF